MKDGKIRIVYKTGFWDREDNFNLDEEFENETNKVKHKVENKFDDGDDDGVKCTDEDSG